MWVNNTDYILLYVLIDHRSLTWHMANEMGQSKLTMGGANPGSLLAYNISIKYRQKQLEAPDL